MPAPSVIASLASLLPSVCLTADLVAALTQRPPTNACDPLPVDVLPAGIILEANFAWLEAVSINMFRSGKGPSRANANQNSRSLRN